MGRGPLHTTPGWALRVLVLLLVPAQVGRHSVPVGGVNTLRVDADGTLRATVATTRDEATYRTAVDRPIGPAPAVPDDTPESHPVPAEAR